MFGKLDFIFHCFESHVNIGAKLKKIYRFMAGKSTTNVTLTNSNQRHQIFLAIT